MSSLFTTNTIPTSIQNNPYVLVFRWVATGNVKEARVTPNLVYNLIFHFINNKQLYHDNKVDTEALNGSLIYDITSEIKFK